MVHGNVIFLFQDRASKLCILFLMQSIISSLLVLSFFFFFLMHVYLHFSMSSDWMYNHLFIVFLLTSPKIVFDNHHRFIVLAEVGFHACRSIFSHLSNHVDLLYMFQNLVGLVCL